MVFWVKVIVGILSVLVSVYSMRVMFRGYMEDALWKLIPKLFMASIVSYGLFTGGMALAGFSPVRVVQKVIEKPVEKIVEKVVRKEVPESGSLSITEVLSKVTPEEYKKFYHQRSALVRGYLFLDKHKDLFGKSFGIQPKLDHVWRTMKSAETGLFRDGFFYGLEPEMTAVRNLVYTLKISNRLLLSEKRKAGALVDLLGEALATETKVSVEVVVQ